jgi:hypothetical protein
VRGLAASWFHRMSDTIACSWDEARCRMGDAWAGVKETLHISPVRGHAAWPCGVLLPGKGGVGWRGAVGVLEGASSESQFESAVRCRARPPPPPPFCKRKKNI